MSGVPSHPFEMHLAHPGELVVRHSCARRLEGIVSKRKDSAYRRGGGGAGRGICNYDNIWGCTEKGILYVIIAITPMLFWPPSGVIFP
jgi:hypothetical protein